jgi:hypothetical protein
MTPSEKLVYELCNRSFLSLWSYASPRRPDGRELCDALVVFSESIVVFSVKDIALSTHDDPAVVEKRWTKKAVDDSIKQLAGAKRVLGSMSSVVRQDGTPGVALPDTASRKTHLVAVAAGANRTFPIAGGDRDVGYVHVLDEIALRTILGELDTAPDFLRYLQAKEAFRGTILCEGEENLLAAYVHAGRRLAEQDLMILEGDLWTEIKSKPEFIARQTADEISYWWDRTIETLIKDYELEPEVGPSPSEHELLVRTMASEDRFSRRVLSGACLDWLNARKAGARNLASKSGTAYVFATYPRDHKRELRVDDLGARCFIARSPAVLVRPTVIGLATEVYDPSGYSLDAMHLHRPEWRAEDEATAQEMKERLGILDAPERHIASLEEFPAVRKQLSRVEKNRQKGQRRKQR